MRQRVGEGSGIRAFQGIKLDCGKGVRIRVEAKRGRKITVNDNHLIVEFKSVIEIELVNGQRVG